jgi:hypothetical protein
MRPCGLRAVPCDPQSVADRELVVATKEPLVSQAPWRLIDRVAKLPSPGAAIPGDGTASSPVTSSLGIRGGSLLSRTDITICATASPLPMGGSRTDHTLDPPMGGGSKVGYDIREPAEGDDVSTVMRTQQLGATPQSCVHSARWRWARGRGRTVAADCTGR